jgi:hypothetical protein
VEVVLSACGGGGPMSAGDGSGPICDRGCVVLCTLKVAMVPVSTLGHRWALTPISVISDIGLSFISELPISN